MDFQFLNQFLSSAYCWIVTNSNAQLRVTISSKLARSSFTQVYRSIRFVGSLVVSEDPRRETNTYKTFFVFCLFVSIPVHQISDEFAFFYAA